MPAIGEGWKDPSARPTTHYRVALPPDERKPVRLNSIVPWDLYISHWSMQATLPAAPEDMSRPGHLMIGPGQSKEDLGNNQQIVIEDIPARVMALDIMGLDASKCIGLMPSQGNESSWWRMGVWVSMGEPIPDEVMAARERFRAWARRKIVEGDSSYASTKNVAAVDPLAKRCAQILRVQREWAQDAVEGSQDVECPACAERIKPKAVKCRFCGEKIVRAPDGSMRIAKEPEAAPRARAAQ